MARPRFWKNLQLLDWFDGKRAQKREQRAARKARGLHVEELEARLVMDSSHALPTPLIAMTPLGSLVFQSVGTTLFTSTPETDSWTINLDAGQTVSAVLTPGNSSIQGRIRLIDPSLVDLGGAEADAESPGRIVAFQPIIAGTAGTYKIDVSNLAGSGPYTIALYLNVSIEEESAGGTANDTIGAAQSIEGSSTALPNGQDRLAVVGVGSVGEADVYGFSLEANQFATLVVSANGTNSAAPALELLNSAGVVVAEGVATDSGLAIRDFKAGSAATYYARLIGAAEGPYSLVATRGSAFDLEPNSQANEAQVLNGPLQVLGGLGRNQGGGAGGIVAVVNTTQGGNEAGFQAIVDQLNDDTFFEFQAHLVSVEDVDTLAELSAYDVVVIGNNGYGGDGFDSIAAPLRAFVEAGGGVVMTGWGIYGSGNGSETARDDLDAIIPVNLAASYDYVYDETVEPNGTAHPVTAGVSPFTVSDTYTEFPRNNAVDADAIILATSLSHPVVVVGNAGFGRGAYLGPIYSGDSSYGGTSLRSGDADRLLEQAVAWVSATDRTDSYAFSASVGDQLVITTATPGDGADEPTNTLDPILELYAPNGDLVATNDDGAVDGRNEVLEYTVPGDGAGTYRVSIRAATSVGDYTLNIAGATGAASPFVVDRVAPADRQGLTTFPAIYRVELNQDVLITSVQAGDLLINGNPATDVNIVDGRTLEFSIASQNIGDETYSASLEFGALTSVSGAALTGFSSSFRFDSHGPRIVAINVDQGEILPIGDLVIVVEFDEAVDPQGLADAFALSFGGLFGHPIYPVSFDYVSDTDLNSHIVTLHYAGLSEGDYGFTAFGASDHFNFSGDPVAPIRDLLGLPLDGNGDGTPGDDFTRTFTLDVIAAVPLEPLAAETPLGSQVYDPLQFGVLHAEGDVDTFTFDVDANQTITVLLNASHGVTASLELIGPGGSLGLLTADAPGAPVLLQSLPAATTGTYSILVTATSRTGFYNFRTILNAAVELEEVFAESNDAHDAAQDITVSSVALQGSADRLAVGGTLGSTYSLSFEDVELNELLVNEVAAMTYAGSDIFLVADANSDFSNLYTVTTAGLVDFLGELDHRTEGLAVVDGLLYSVGTDRVLRQLSLETGETLATIELQGLPDGASITDLATDPITGQLWGIAQGNGAPRLVTIDPITGVVVIGSILNFGSTLSFRADGQLFVGPGSLHRVDPQSGASQFVGSLYYGGGGEAMAFLDDGRLFQMSGNGDPLQAVTITEFADSVDHFSFALSAGQAASLSVNPRGFGDQRFPLRLDLLDANGTVVALGAHSASNIEVAIRNFVAPADGVYVARVSLAAGARDYGLLVTRSAAFDFEDGTGANDFGLTGQVHGYTGADADSFLFNVTEATTLTFTTATPGDGSGQFINNLDPIIELYQVGSSGGPLVGDDNGAADDHNALLTYDAEPGEYRVVIRGVNDTAGEYSLRVQSSTPGAVVAGGQFVASSELPSGTAINYFPATYRILLSHDVMLDSVQATDLEINGQPATDVVIVDGRTLVFTIGSLDAGGGTYTAAMADGALTSLAGDSLASFVSLFEVDAAGPFVVLELMSFQAGTVLGLGDLSFTATFNEYLANDGLDAGDVVLSRLGHDDIAPISFVHDFDSRTITVGFSDLPEGNYELKFLSGASEFRDELNNPLDGNADGMNGDHFVLPFSVDDADTRPLATPLEAVTPRGSLIFDPPASGTLHAGDTDAFTISLDAGQKATVVLTTADPTLLVHVQLIALDGGAILGEATASAAGLGVVLQNLAIVTEGSYEIRISSVSNSSGNYELQLFVNASVEEEGRTGTSNNTVGTAQNIDSSVIALQGSASRLAAFGSLTAASDAVDLYAFTLGVAQVLDLVVTPQGNDAAPKLELLDSSGIALAQGVGGATNVGARIRNFSAAAATYYVRLTLPTSSSTYSLLVLRDAEFDQEPNSQADNAQVLTGPGNVLGSLGSRQAGSGGGGVIKVAVHQGEYSSVVVNQLNNDTWFDFNAVAVPNSGLDSVAELSAYDVVVLGNPFDHITPEAASAIQTWFEAGQGGVVGTAWLYFNVINYSTGARSNLDAIIPINLSANSRFNISTVTMDATHPHPVTAGLPSFSIPSGDGNSGGVDEGAEILATNGAGGAPVVVVKETGGSRSVWLGPAYFYFYDLTSGNADRLLEQAVAWTAATDHVDQYQVQANVGDELVITTTTPGDGAHEPVNDLDPILELYDPDGELVASNDNGGPGRNARIEYTIPADAAGAYRVVVRSDNTTGDYTLAVTGATGVSTPAFAVQNVTPLDGALLTVYPATYRVAFNHDVLLTSVQPGDLRVNGAAASVVTVIDGRTLEFAIAGADAGDGLYTVTISPGAIVSTTGEEPAFFSATFDVDATNPVVIFSSIAEGDVVETGDLTYQVQFSEELATANLGVDDVAFVRTDTDAQIDVESFSYDAGTSTLTVTFASLEEGSYQLRLRSQATGFRDRRGNLLDGGPSSPLPSGGGSTGDDYLLNFTVDTGTRAYPTPLEAKPPAGSLVYDPIVDGFITPASDTDAFTLSVEAGQLLTVVVTPDDDLAPTVQLLALDGTVIASQAGGVGARAIIQVQPIADGATYKIIVGGTDGTSGAYSVQVILNAQAEVENGGADNNTTGAAEDMTPSLLTLTGGASRLAVIGVSDNEDDFYQVNLDAGTYATVTAAALAGSVTALELFDGAGALLALGVLDEAGASMGIANFLASGGTYFVRVRGSASAVYDLVVIRGANLDTEPNDDLGKPQALEGPLVVLGGIQADSQYQVDFSDVGGNAGLEGFTATGLWHVTDQVGANLSGHSAPHIAYFGIDASANFNQGAPSGTLTSGPLTLRADANPQLSLKYRLQSESGTYYDAAEVRISTNGGQSYTTVADKNSHFGQTLNWTASTVDLSAFAGQTILLQFSFAARDSIANTGLGWQIDDIVVTGVTDLQDHFSFRANAGDALVITTATPGDGAGEPVNAFDPVLELFNSAGVLVANDDNSAADDHNAELSYSATETGIYTLRIRGANGGSYQATIAGSTANNLTAPYVAAVVPADAAALANAPAALIFTWSESIRADSVDPSDLVFSTPGATVTGVEQLDGRTLRFTLDVPEAAGVYEYQIAASALNDLQGLGNTAFSGSFNVDRVGPRVVTTNPTTQASAPFSEITFVFDEAIDRDSVSTADVTAFTGPSGNNLRGSLNSVSVNGNEITFTFDQQNAAGQYTMTIGPNLTDLVGNAMDQDGNGSPNGYTVSLMLQSPDLSVSAVEGPGSSQFGQTVSVTYTVRNLGDDPALESWQDAIYLSSDNVLDRDDRKLKTFPSSPTFGPLAPNGESNDRYERTEEVQLPLDLTSASGTYFLIVETDTGRRQPESSENNNSRASSSVSITLPPLPDLIVSDIQAPIEALSGQEIQITWTVLNQGTAPFTGTLRDQVFLSPDNAAGSDQFFNNFDFTGTIAAGQSLTRTQRITLPINLEGTHYVVIRTEALNQAFEHNGENNNVTVDDVAIEIALAPLPNLRVSSVTPPETAFSSQQTVVEWTVTNVGTGPTNASIWYDGVYLSTDDVLDDQDVFLDYTANHSYLGDGESYASSLQVTLPRGIDGPYRFIVKTDVFNHVYEHNSENDNTRAGAVTAVTLTPPPDLQVTNVNAPTQAFSGQPMTVAWTVTNNGPGQTLETAWTDYVYMSEDNILDGADRFLGQLHHSGVLVPGASYSPLASLSVNLPVGVAGDFFIFIRADAVDQVFEHAYENNNSGFDAVPVHINLTPPPDLVVTQVNAPTAAVANHTLTVSFTVANEGATETPNSSWYDRLYLSADETLNTATDLRLATLTHYGKLDAGDEYDGTFEVTLPNTLSGVFYAFVVTDQEPLVFELDPDRVNNRKYDTTPVVVDFRPPDLVVDSFEAPGTGVAGASILVNYQVTNVGIGDTVAANWTDQVVLSTDNQLGNGDDLVLLNAGHSGVLNPTVGYSATNVAVPIPLTVPSGNYFLFFRTDASGSVFEHVNEGNNASASVPINISRNTADLQVTEVEFSPDALLSGEELTVTWTVRNLGAATTNANYWSDRVYLSMDGDLGNGDIYLGAVQHNNPLTTSPDSFYEATRSFTLPSDLQGTYFVIVYTDYDNRVVEGDGEANNAATAQDMVSVTQRPLPDLRVTSVAAPATAFAGQLISLSWTVQNFGPGAAAGYWHDSVYLSLDQNYDSGDRFLGYAVRPNNLPNGADYTHGGSFRIPQGMAGPFYVFVITDAGRDLREGDEFNNAKHDGEVVDVGLLPPADLVIGSIDVPDTGIPGRNIRIDYTVDNQGANAAQGEWTDTLYLSADNVWDVGDLLIGRVAVSETVPGGSNYSKSLTAPAPGVNPGEYFVIVRTDILNNLTELDETNNLKASLDNVDFDVEELTLGAADTDNLPTGASVFYKLVMPTANETVRFTFDSASNFGDTEIFVRYGAMPSRTRFDFTTNDPFQADQTLTIPADQAGTYYILVYRRNVSGDAGYSLKAELVPFSISRVTATAGGDVGAFTVKIEGAKFLHSTEFELVAPGVDGNVYAAVGKVVRDSTTAYVTFNMTFADLGEYTLRARNGILETALASPFLLQASTGSDVITDIEASDTLRPGRTYTLQLFYANQGNQDEIAPLILMESLSGTPIGLSATTQVSGVPLHVLGVSPDGPLGILRPGARGSVFVSFSTTTAAQGVDIQVRRILATDTTVITDEEWLTIEQAVRPLGIEDEVWDSFWSGIRSRLGGAWGDYVRFLNQVLANVGDPGEPNNDVRALMAQMIAEFPTFRPSSQFAGTMIDAASGNPLANVQIAAYRDSGTGFQLAGVETTDAQGGFVFPALSSGNYFLAVDYSLYFFDQDRDAYADADSPTVAIPYDEDVAGGTYYVAAVPAEEILEDNSSPVVVPDSAGNLHLVWVKEGALWHAVDRGAGWVEAQAIRDAVGGRDPQAQWSDNLLGTGEGGLLVGYVLGESNTAEVWYSVARLRSADNLFEWSEPVAVTVDSTYDGGLALEIDENGRPLFVFQKQDMDLEGGEDADIYFWHDEVQASFPAEVLQAVVDDALANLSAELDAEAVHRIRLQNIAIGPWTLPSWVPYIGGTYALDVRGSVVVDTSSCAPTGSIGGELKAKIGNNGEITGTLAGRAGWVVNKKTCEYEFSGAAITIGVNGALDIPLTSWSLPIIGKVDVGLRIEASGAGRGSWQSTDPFPSFPSDWEGRYRIGGGGFGKFKADVWFLGSVDFVVRVIVSGNFVWNESGPDFGTPPWQVSALVRGEVKVGTYKKFVEYTFTYGPGGVETTDVGALNPFSMSPGSFGYEAIQGTANDYSTTDVHLVSQNLIEDTTPSLARNLDGDLFGAWAGDGGVQVRAFDAVAGTWGSPIFVTGTAGSNIQYVTMAFEDDGDALVVWSQDDTILTPDSTTEEIEESFLRGGDLMYAIYDADTGAFGAAAPWFELFGSDQEVSLQRDADGNILATWLHSEYNEAVDLYSSVWDAGNGAWSAPQIITTGNVSGRATLVIRQGNPVAMWTELLPSEVADGNAPKVLKTSTFAGGVWSAPVLVTYALLPSALGQSANSETSDAPLQSLVGLPFSPPPECCECKLKEPPPPPPCGTWQSLDRVKCEYVTHYKPCVVQPRDPNDIVAPEGFGEEHWIKADQKIPYMIRFENAADASAPAQVVTITQTLDPDLNPSSFRLGSFGFDNLIFQGPDNKAFYNARLDLTETRGFYVDVAASIDVASRQAFWTFTTIDPATGEQPLDANVGFLPVNNETGRGEGFVSYVVRPRTTVQTGTRIDAGFVDEDNDFRATIVFDTEGPILTPSVFNTLDADKPTSAVNALPANAGADAFDVSWEGTDPNDGAGIALFDIYVSIDGGDYSAWLENTELRSAEYVGSAGHSYAFFSVATDNAGNVEDAPLSADAITATPGGTATLGNFVWRDTDGDGIQDQDEAGVAGVTVNLYRAADNVIVSTDLTDSEGAYLFTGLGLADQYYLEFIAIGYAFTAPDQGADNTLDSDASITTGRTIAFSVVNGDNNQWDAGVFTLGSIAGVVWDDADANGVKNGSEQFLQGWLVYIDSNDDGDYDADLNEPNQETDAFGAYSFTGLRPGTYIVAQVLPPGWEQTFPGPAGSNSTNSGVHRTYTFSGSDTVLASPGGVEVNTALSTIDCGCHRSGNTTTTVNGVVVVGDNFHPWADLIELDAYRADTQFAAIDGRGSSVVVIDTGIDVDHSFFGADADGNGVADRIVYQWDFADRDADATDRTGHGSHVASIVGSEDGRYAGLAPGANIIALKVFGDNGRGYFSYVEQALDWVIQHANEYNIVAVNLSVGDGLNWGSPIAMHGLGDELAALSKLNVVTVAAAGNSYGIYNEQGLAYPAADPNTIAVGAVWDGDRGGPWSFGSLGTDYTTDGDRIVSFSQRDNEIDLFAPGAVVGGANATGGVAWLRGTSMATPQVTGATVLAQQIAQETLGRRLRTDELRALLRSSGTAIVDGDDEDDSVHNTGLNSYRLDVYAFALAVLTYDGSYSDDTTSDPTNGGNGGGNTGTQTNRPFRYTIDLAAEQNRTDVDFGDKFVPPEIIDVVDIAPDPRNTAVDSVEFTFSEVIDVNTLDSSDVTLTHNAVAIDLSGLALQFEQVGTSSTYRVTGLASATDDEGDYVLTVAGAGVQSADGVSGTGVALDDWVVDLTAPAAAFDLAITPDTGVSESDGETKTGAVTFWGSLSESDLLLHLFDETTGADLGDAVVTGMSFSQSLNLAAGLHRVRAVAEDPAGNLAPESFFDIFVDLSEPAAPSSLAITPDSGGSSNDGKTNTGTVTLSGALGEANLQVHLFDVTDNVPLGDATVNGQTFAKALNLSEGLHRIRAIAEDNAGNLSPDSFFDVFVDLTPPSAGIVNDGDAADIDIQASTTSIRANWSGFSDGGSGIADYQWAIGTTVGGTEEQAFTSVGNVTSAEVLGLNLSEGVTYFVTVKAIDSAGHESATASSDGVTVNSSNNEAPISSVQPLPAYSLANFTLHWSGSDSDDGIASYDIFVSDDGAAFALFLDDTTQTSEVFAGQPGHHYRFYSVASDNAGNPESKSPLTEAETRTPLFDAALPAINEDATAPTGQKVRDLLQPHVNDPSGQLGLAVAQLEGNGVWQYSANGKTWLNFGAVSVGQARLLSPSYWLRFVPASNWHGQARLFFHTWDGTQGTAGGFGSVAATGAGTPFSTRAAQVSVQVNAVNDAPQWTTNSTTLTIANNSSAIAAGKSIVDAAGAFFQDIDGNTTCGVAVMELTGTASGTWQYSRDNGANWLDFGAVSEVNARLLTADDLIRFIPNGGSLAKVSIRVRAWDGSTGAAGDTANLTTGGKIGGDKTGGSTAYSSSILAVNFKLNSAPTLGSTTGPEISTNENQTSAAVTVTSLLAGAQAQDTDPGALMGVAIVGASGPGTWQYSLNGTTWFDLGGVSQTSARLLASSARLRFVPAANQSGQGSLTYRAWDQTMGTNGNPFTILETGGGTAFSDAQAVSNLIVHPDNGAPV